MQLGLQHLSGGGAVRRVLRHTDLAPVQLEQLDLLPVFLAAQNKPDGRLLSLSALVFIQPSQVQFHLALVGGIETAQLQLNGHQPVQAVVEE